MRRRSLWSVLVAGVGLGCFLWPGFAVAAPLLLPDVDIVEQDAASAPVAQVSEMAQLKDEIRARMDGTIWTLELTPLNGGKKAHQDTLTFEGRTISSSRLTQKGYGSTNYGLLMSGDGILSWETMQRNARGDTVFWRGALDGEMIRGTLHMRSRKGKQIKYSFTGTQTGRIEREPTPGLDASAPESSPQ